MDATLQPGRSYFWPNTPDQLKPLYKQVGLVDQLHIDGRELGAKEWRLLIPAIYARPHGKNRLILITDANAISEIVQNMLLKVLEEPPSETSIVLIDANANSLLPTLRSRLQILPSLQSINTNDVTMVVGSLLAGSSSALAVLQKPRDRAELIAVLRLAFEQLTTMMLKTPTSLLLRHSELLEQALLRLTHNCNQKIVIDDLVLRMFDEPGNEITEP